MRLATVVVFLAVALAVFSPSGASVGAAPQSGPALGYAPDEVVVKFRDDVDVDPQVFARSIGATIHKSAEHKRGVPHRVYLLKVPAATLEATVRRLSRHPLVEFAEVNRIYYTTAIPNDPRFGEQWQYNNTGQKGGTPDADIDAPEAWDVTMCNPAVVIGILDTGVDQNHPDITPKIVINVNSTFFSPTVDDRYGHGTHVAGSAAAVTNNGIGVAGTAPDCKIANIKVLEDFGGGYEFAIAVGIYQCALVAHVCNMSFGGSVSSSLIEFYINEASLLGAVLVAAAGNSGTNSLLFPCAYEVVICVGATNNKDEKASFSTYGPHVDVGAPGEAILSTAPNHRNTIWRRPQTYGTLSGTSMAAPHVSGVAGLARGLCSDNACTRSRVESGADQILTGFFAKGRLNARGSVAP